LYKGIVRPYYHDDREHTHSRTHTFTPTGCSNYSLHIRLYKSYIDELPTVSHFGTDNNV